MLPNKSIMVAALALPIPKLIIVIPLAVAHDIGLSNPTILTFFQAAKSLSLINI